MPDLQRCAACGQLIPPKIRFGGHQQRIYAYIAAHPEGVSPMQIVEHLYAHDANGGPSTTQIVRVQICKIRKSGKLKAEGLKIVTEGRLYYLRAIADGPKA
jgi:hypothetical protein